MSLRDKQRASDIGGVYVLCDCGRQIGHIVSLTPPIAIQCTRCGTDLTDRILAALRQAGLRDNASATRCLKPQVRPRTTGLAIGLLILVVWLMAVLARCTAAYRTAVVTADFAQAANLAHWSLALNIPFEFTVTYDDTAPDLEPSPLLGRYETPECYTTLRFGPYYISVPHTEVRVWHGWDGVAEGISFGNRNPFTAYGLNVEGYRLYAFFPNFFFTTPGFDDSLAQVALRATDPHFRYNSYVFLYGWTWWETYLQTSQPVSYSLPIVTPNPK